MGVIAEDVYRGSITTQRLPQGIGVVAFAIDGGLLADGEGSPASGRAAHQAPFQEQPIPAAPSED